MIRNLENNKIYKIIDSNKKQYYCKTCKRATNIIYKKTDHECQCEKCFINSDNLEIIVINSKRELV